MRRYRFDISSHQAGGRELSNDCIMCRGDYRMKTIANGIEQVLPADAIAHQVSDTSFTLVEHQGQWWSVTSVQILGG